MLTACNVSSFSLSTSMFLYSFHKSIVALRFSHELQMTILFLSFPKYLRRYKRDLYKMAIPSNKIFNRHSTWRSLRFNRPVVNKIYFQGRCPPKDCLTYEQNYKCTCINIYICVYMYIHMHRPRTILKHCSINWLRSSSNVGNIRNARKSQLVDRFCRKIVSYTVKRSHRISWCGEMPTDLAELKRTWGSSSASSFVSPLRSFLPLVFLFSPLCLSLYRLLFCSLVLPFTKGASLQARRREEK